MNMTIVNEDVLLQALKQAREETKTGLCDLFTAKLERLAAHIRTDYLSPIESAELLEQEAEAMRQKNYENVA
ncbi:MULTISPECIES: DUF2732 family protein [unclassified Gilliamella]|uniref:DUF2732 family protein n=1 Tax=unclassified Gilliamella TaxID=2685620 RepID=UPI00080E1090|nr:DUF2732 family protein [Gilliamella apicola]OCG20556.1 hypothetical protein A9G23_06955 [Gilliamella apicola]OCG24565.1 hypothetical protein A9G22_03915 [Gilliamella apicola]